MPVPALKNLAKKHGVRMKTAEKKWQEAKAIVSKEYDEDSPKYWGTVMNITKNKLAKHSKKHEELNLEMPLFSMNEQFERTSIQKLVRNIIIACKIDPDMVEENDPEFIDYIAGMISDWCEKKSKIDIGIE